MFALKQWLWRKWQMRLGTDRAYARYLAHFEHYQKQVVSGELQTALKLTPMSKEAFIQAWHQPGVKSEGKSCGCSNTGCCN